MKKGRPFTIADAMILIGAAAVGFGGMSHYAAYEAENLRPRTAFSALLGVTCLLVSGSVAVVMLGLRHPRARLSRLALRPGFAANLAVIAAVLSNAFFVGKHLFYIPAGWTRTTTLVRALETVLWPYAIVAAIVATWCPIALSARWRPEPHWIDRLGRMLAASWFVAAVWIAWLAD